ncbi:hypothetical protein TRFO_25782 [Tritrichomonas foetus]|uniref:F5/8 type C domain-containing protein n=1 Tax=Tritrichomonas foetus TaxID=1144522 RepID=A0A1J4K9V4_9EUKA|nr:hypothetical protein TRFO_25782 [Tritrichomonas foetus]|eukprot:OHT06229.1 hypothetical protein TRFO_25782 [Tritrichomonas foetus]
MIVIYFLFLNSFSISPPSENLHRAVFTNEIIPNSPHVEQSSTQNRLLTTDQAKTSQDPSVLDGLVKFPDQSYWSVLGSSEIADNNHEGPAKYLLDDKNNTFWHSDKNQTGSYYFIINLKYAMKIGGFAYVPRPSGANGLFKDYKFFIGSSIEDVRNKITNNGTSTNEGRFSYTNDEGDHSRETHYVRLADEVETSFVGLSSSGTGGFGSCAEFLIYVKPINSFVGLEKIADRSNWELTESSELVNNGHEGPVEYLIDGNNNTFWHSFLSTEGNYHYFIINLKYKATISGFEYQPRPVGANGLFKDYQFFTGFSKDEIMDKFKSNSFAKEGQFKYADTTSNTSNHVHETQYVRLDNDIECSFVGLRSKGNNGFASCAEFNLYVKHKNGLYGLEKISDRSDWTVISNSELSQTGNEGPAQNILDNNSGTTWHSASMSENSSFYFIVNMKYCISISGFQYIPRSSEANGVFVNYKFFTGKSYDEILNKIKHHDQGTSTIEGVFIYPELETGKDTNTESKSEFETLLKSEPEKDSNSETKNTIEEVNPGETHSQSKLVDPPTAIQPSLPIHYTLDNAISIDTTNSHVGLESNISTDSKELTNKNNIGLIAGITVGGIAFIAIVILLILFFLYRKRKADASNFSDVTIEMDEGALNIIQTNNDMNDDDYVSNNILNSDFIENPFVENENQDSNQHYSDNFISDLDE